MANHKLKILFLANVYSYTNKCENSLNDSIILLNIVIPDVGHRNNSFPWFLKEHYHNVTHA